MKMMAIFQEKQILSVIREKFGFNRLEPREKKVVGIGMVVVGCILLLQFVISPYLQARRQLAVSLASRKSDLAQIVKLQQEYRGLKNISGAKDSRVSRHPAGFSLFSFVEEQSARAKIKQQILSMRPSTLETEGPGRESVVEMKLQKVSLGQLVGFLKLIESSEQAIFVRQISIQQSIGENLLDIVMQIATRVDTT